MKKLERLIQNLIDIDTRRDRQEALRAAKELWHHPYEAEIKDQRIRVAYISALFYVSDYFRLVEGIPYNAIGPLKRAYSLDDGVFNPAANSSAKEAAAFKLGTLFEQAKCHHSAAYWLRQSLNLARSTHVEENILLNLNHLARNLETLRLYEEAGRCYDEILSKLGSSVPSDSDHFEYFVHAATYQLQHGNKSRGEALMRMITSDHLEPSATHTKSYVDSLYSSTHELGLHYINSGQFKEAIQLARTVIKKVEQFAELNWVRVAMHGLIARAFVHQRQLDPALKELMKARKFEGELNSYKDSSFISSREQLIDIARIQIALHDYESAIAAYATLAYDLGAVISDADQAPTTRLRFYWLQQMAFVVHEMVSAWLAHPEMHTDSKLEPAVANVLLQLKANLFIAMERHKNIRGELGDTLFHANRRYATNARKAANDPEDPETLLELEDSIFAREEVEKHLLSREFISAPDRAMIFQRDFRDIYLLRDGTIVLDYSLINYQPPEQGLMGQSKGLRYVGVRLAAGNLSLIDLGAAQEIEDLCRPLVKACSSPAVTPDLQRNFKLVTDVPFKDKVDLNSLSQRVYDQLVAPFEPLSKSLLFSPDGMLAAVPYHALIHNDRYLVEDTDVAYCHSLLQRESLALIYSSSLQSGPPPLQQVAVILGNPTYAQGLPALPGTEIEVAEVAKLLRNQKFKDGSKVYDGVRLHTGTDATASQLLQVDQPIVVHIAAHGTFDDEHTRIFAEPIPTLGTYYRRYQKMGSEPLTTFDNALLHSTLVLAEDSESKNDPTNGSFLTALELASLNLTRCNIVVLSACETGAGATEYGAGVLGFQYALQACFARFGLLSLWKVLDRETSAFMIDFYQNAAAAATNFKAAYQATLRKYCRRNGQRVHPYYWAAFVFLDQEYYEFPPGLIFKVGEGA